MQSHRMVWLGGLVVALLSATLVPDQADAGSRRARRYGYGYGCGCGYQQPVVSGCCGVAAQTIYQQPYQQTVWQQPYQQTSWQMTNACAAEPVSYQTYNHTTGYAPQGAQAPPPPVEQPPQQPQTFQEAPEPNP